MIFSIFQQFLIATPLLIGAYITLSLLKLPDFSVESAYLFGAVSAFLFREAPFPFILLAPFFGGLVVGSLVSFFNHYLKLPFLLAAIVTNGLFHGITQFLLGTSQKAFHPNLPLSEIALFSLLGVVLFLFCGLAFRSQLGYSMAIYGNNSFFFHHIPVCGPYVLFSGVMLGHGLAGIGGFLFALSNGFIDLTMNFGIILLSLTALILGKLVFRSPRPNILLPLVGGFLYFCLQHTLLSMGINLKYFNAFQALFVLAILSLFQKKEKYSLNLLGV